MGAAVLENAIPDPYLGSSRFRGASEAEQADSESDQARLLPVILDECDKESAPRRVFVAKPILVLH
jgi:hypothetical protein